MKRLTFYIGLASVLLTLAVWNVLPIITAKPIFNEGQKVVLLGKGEYSYACFDKLIEVPYECINPYQRFEPPQFGDIGFITKGGDADAFFVPPKYYRVCTQKYLCAWYQQKDLQIILPDPIDPQFIRTH
ncbi:hypothetical protein HYW55_00965 [Candidatus Gottesmanbacteria bacterium]|nr:hypothetical protein [Candidatus Gottesmanbacteria bacterium]